MQDLAQSWVIAVRRLAPKMELFFSLKLDAAGLQMIARQDPGLHQTRRNVADASTSITMVLGLFLGIQPYGNDPIEWRPLVPEKERSMAISMGRRLLAVDCLPDLIDRDIAKARRLSEVEKTLADYVRLCETIYREPARQVIPGRHAWYRDPASEL